MNKVFDYNGHMVSTSKPVKNLRTVKKVVSIDSADRDTSKYYTNGDFMIYLPRTYENVVSIRLMSAEFPPIYDSTSAGALTHAYTAGNNVASSTFSGDTKVTATTYYFFVDVDVGDGVTLIVGVGIDINSNLPLLLNVYLGSIDISFKNPDF